MSGESLVFISVVVISFNEERYLERCLKALSNQDYPRDRFEIISVDNGSTDRSVEISRSFADQVEVHPRIKVGALRNIGAKIAKGEVLAFLDGDCEAKMGWLQEINKLYLLYPETVNGSECLIDSNAPWVPKAWFCTNKMGRQATVSLGASNVFIPKQIFNTIGGFNEKLTTGEDAELFRRISEKWEVFYDSRLLAVHHGVPLTIRSFFNREVWHGLGALGSFKINWFDKPLIATIAFIIGIILTFDGLFYFLAFKNGGHLLAGLALMGLIPLLSVIYRLGYVRSYLHFLQLFVLYFIYYLARSASLVILTFRIDHPYYKRDRD